MESLGSTPECRSTVVTVLFTVTRFVSRCVFFCFIFSCKCFWSVASPAQFSPALRRRGKASQSKQAGFYFSFFSLSSFLCGKELHWGPVAQGHKLLNHVCQDVPQGESETESEPALPLASAEQGAGLGLFLNNWKTIWVLLLFFVLNHVPSF